MRALLDTNVIIHRETNRIIIPEIGNLFYWLDQLKYEKCVHPLTSMEIQKHADPIVVSSFNAKLKSYIILKTEAPESPQIEIIRKKYDQNDNDFIDTSLLKEVYNKRVDILISEDKKLHKKARELEIQDRVFTVDSFLEKVIAENPDLVDYKVLSVKKELFGNIRLADPFFDSFKQDYPEFEKWFNKKADETAYICKGEKDEVLAFLYVKQEGLDENYANIEPRLEPKRRLKIGTFKVIINGFKLGERFLKIIFDNAMLRKVDEIYVTIFDKTEDQLRLIDLMQEWGFYKHGVKHSPKGDEFVYVRDFMPAANRNNPKVTFPYFSGHTRKFIVPIYPEYHTELFPDSILRTESPSNFVEQRPNRNAIHKVYISRSIERDLKPGDIIVFYRTADRGAAHYTSVTTTIGVVESVITNISTLEKFIESCRKRSVFSDKELEKYWNYNLTYRPFVVNFLYAISLTNRLNRKYLLELGIIGDKPPRGFVLLSDKAFQILMEKSHADKRHVVD